MSYISLEWEVKKAVLALLEAHTRLAEIKIAKESAHDRPAGPDDREAGS